MRQMDSLNTTTIENRRLVSLTEELTSENDLKIKSLQKLNLGLKNGEDILKRRLAEVLEIIVNCDGKGSWDNCRYDVKMVMLNDKK